MELSDLRVFASVARDGGIVRAAEKLHRAQSSITSRIQALEERLGVKLFQRVGRRLELSAAGKVLLTYADRIMELAGEAENVVRGDQPIGLLRLGAMESTAAARLPEPLGRFHEMYPEVALELYSGDPKDLIARVIDAELDAALVADPIADARLQEIGIYDEELVIVAEARHPPISMPADLVVRSVLAFHPGCPHRARFEEWFRRGHSTPERVVEVGSYHLILGCVAVGMGVALVPRSVLGTYPDLYRFSVHPLPIGLRKAKVKLVWRRDLPHTNVSALASILQAHGRMV